LLTGEECDETLIVEFLDAVLLGLVLLGEFLLELLYFAFKVLLKIGHLVIFVEYEQFCANLLLPCEEFVFNHLVSFTFLYAGEVHLLLLSELLFNVLEQLLEECVLLMDELGFIFFIFIEPFLILFLILLMNFILVLGEDVVDLVLLNLSLFCVHFLAVAYFGANSFSDDDSVFIKPLCRHVYYVHLLVVLERERVVVNNDALVDSVDFLDQIIHFAGVILVYIKNAVTEAVSALNVPEGETLAVS
jgi:hypothetical protein